MFKKLKNYISDHKLEIGILIFILLIAAFLRLYRISDYMTFLGDEGRDAIVAREILHGKFTLLGPRASAGDFFLGPVYYYMMAPFLLLFNYDPVGPAVMVALFGVATVFLVYYVGLKFFNSKTGLMAASLYAVSPIVIAYSRSSWNPNVMPFFSLLMLYLLFVALKKQSYKLFLVVGLLLGILMQLHYLSTFLGVIVLIFIAIGEVFIKKSDLFVRYIKHYLEIFTGFLVGFSPFLLFEIRHSFPNMKAIIKFVFEDNATKSYPIHQTFLSNISGSFLRIFGRLITKFPPLDQPNIFNDPYILLWILATVILAVLSVATLFYAKDKIKILLISLWMFLSIVLFGFYKKPIYDYYFGFVFPLPFLLIGGFLSKISELKKYKKTGLIVSYTLFIGLMFLNLSGNPFQFAPNRQKDEAKNVADFVLSKTDGKPFNFALLTDGNSDHLFRYFFEVENRAPVTILNSSIDPQRNSVTSQLMVVCEKQVCLPLGNSLWEVAGFGRADIAGEWDVPYVKIYKLVHYKGN